jgi:hypothetical protein
MRTLGILFALAILARGAGCGGDTSRPAMVQNAPATVVVHG